MKLISTIIAALALTGAASAQSGDLIEIVTQEDLEAFVVDQGHQVLGTGEAGAVSVRAETEDGTVYYLTGTACSDLGECQGINMSARFDVNEFVTYEKINNANIAKAAVSVWQLENTLGISRYVILDYGVTMENIQSNFDNFLAIVPAVIDSFYD